MTLYDLSAAFQAALNAGEDGELNEDTEKALADLQVAFEAKVDGCLKFRAGLLADAESIDQEIRRLKARHAALTRRAEWLKGYVQQSMEQTGVGVISTALFRAAVVKSPLKVEVADDAVLPPPFLRTKTEVTPDKQFILALWKDKGELPPGVKVTQGFHLKIS